MVPEALAGEPAGAQGEEAAKGGGVESAGEAGLGAGGEAAVEDGGEQVGADRRAGAALGDMAVDVLDELQAAGEGEQGGGGTEFAHDRLQWLGEHGGGTELLDDLVGAAEIGLGNDLGLAVDAFADAGVVVGVAADDLLDDAGRISGHTKAEVTGALGATPFGDS